MNLEVRKIDTGIDFIQPEFLNIIFFQQKNLVVFPYVDLKHLHGLENFTVGYNVIDLESTALYNIKEIIEFEANNCYSQNKTLFFIYSLDKPKVQDIMGIEGIRCVLNTNDDMKTLANGNKEFVFYNKKKNTFTNYHTPPDGLAFERHLIATSESETILYEKIQKIKIIATKIFTEINNHPDSYESNISQILDEYDLAYWEKILDFTRSYFQIEIPVKNLARSKPVIKKDSSSVPNEQQTDILREFKFIKSLNRPIANEFIKLLHVYRSQKVNPSNLDLKQLYHPQRLYVYLRTHHWKKQIDPNFFYQLSQMKLTGYALTERDLEDLAILFKKFGVKMDNVPSSVPDKTVPIKHSNPVPKSTSSVHRSSPKKSIDSIPKARDFNNYKRFVLRRLQDIEALINKKST